LTGILKSLQTTAPKNPFLRERVFYIFSCKHSIQRNTQAKIAPYRSYFHLVLGPPLLCELRRGKAGISQLHLMKFSKPSVLNNFLHGNLQVSDPSRFNSPEYTSKNNARRRHSCLVLSAGIEPAPPPSEGGIVSTPTFQSGLRPAGVGVKLVSLGRVELPSPASEASILSIKLQRHLFHLNISVFNHPFNVIRSF
jgi:hypothetical protein